MGILKRPLTRTTSQFPERLVKRVLRESSIAGQVPQGFENGIHLDFLNDFHYIKVPGADPVIAPFTTLFTFTGDALSKYRGSNGLLRSSVTNTPRIEFDANGNCLGLLVEGSRTNLCLQSQDLSTTWVNDNSSESVNTAIAPDGTTTADTLIENSSNSTHGVTQAITVTAATNGTLSCWVKSSTRTKGYIQFVDAATGLIGCRVDFDATAGTISGGTALTTGTYTSSSIESYSNGWYRVILIGHLGGAITAGRVDIKLSDSGGTRSYVGDGTSGLFVWGVQFEQASFSSSYIPTTTVSVTRANEVCTASLINWIATPFTMFCKARKTEFSATTYVWALNDGTLEAGQYFISTTGKVTANITTTLDSNTSINSVVNIFQKGAFVANTNDAVPAQNGTLGTQDTSVTIPAAFTTINIGRRASGNYFNGHIHRLDYWPERKSNSELQRLTS